MVIRCCYGEMLRYVVVVIRCCYDEMNTSTLHMSPSQHITISTPQATTQSDCVVAYGYFLFHALAVAPDERQLERDIRIDSNFRFLVNRTALSHLERDIAVGAERIAVDALSVEQLHVERNVRVLYVGTNAEDILDKVSDWRQTGPADEVVEHGAEATRRKTTHMADALVACLYE